MIFVLIVSVGGILLQIFLSKRESKWLGFILPILTFCASLIYIFSVLSVGDLPTVIMTMMLTFLLCNIPTAILLAVYAACRGMQNRRFISNKAGIPDAE